MSGDLRGRTSGTATVLQWDTRAETIGLNIPKLRPEAREGSFFPTFLEACRTAEKALMAVAIVSRTVEV